MYIGQRCRTNREPAWFLKQTETTVECKVFRIIEYKKTFKEQYRRKFIQFQGKKVEVGKIKDGVLEVKECRHR